METSKFPLHQSSVNEHPSIQFPVTVLFCIKGVRLSLSNPPHKLSLHSEAKYIIHHTSFCHSRAAITSTATS